MPDEDAVLIGGAEIDIDAFDLVALEAEEFGIAKTLPTLGHASEMSRFMPSTQPSSVIRFHMIGLAIALP